MCFDQIHPNPSPPILPPVCPTTIPSQFHVLKKKVLSPACLWVVSQGLHP